MESNSEKANSRKETISFEQSSSQLVGSPLLSSDQSLQNKEFISQQRTNYLNRVRSSFKYTTSGNSKFEQYPHNQSLLDKFKASSTRNVTSFPSHYSSSNSSERITLTTQSHQQTTSTLQPMEFSHSSSNLSAFYSLTSELTHLFQPKPATSRLGDKWRRKNSKNSKRGKYTVVSSAEMEDDSKSLNEVKDTKTGQSSLHGIDSSKVVFPPDHVEYKRVMYLVDKLSVDRQVILKKFIPVLQDPLARYSNLSSLLHKEWRFSDFYTPEERTSINSLSGRQRSWEVIRVNTLCVRRRREQNERELDRQRGIFSRLVERDEHAFACDGCDISPRKQFELRPSPSGENVLLRGFRGNEEMKEVYTTSRYHLPSEEEQATFHVTGICVTTYVRIS